MTTNFSRLLASLSSTAALLALGACDVSEADRSQAQQAARQAVDATRTAGAGAAQDLKEASARAAVITDKAVGAASELTAKVVEDLRLDDRLIAAKVSTGLAADKSLSALKIKVDARDGMVTLRGPAPSAAARARAEEIARNVKGVTSVDNQLAVQAG